MNGARVGNGRRTAAAFSVLPAPNPLPGVPGRGDDLPVRRRRLVCCVSLLLRACLGRRLADVAVRCRAFGRNGRGVARHAASAVGAGAAGPDARLPEPAAAVRSGLRAGGAGPAAVHRVRAQRQPDGVGHRDRPGAVAVLRRRADPAGAGRVAQSGSSSAATTGTCTA